MASVYPKNFRETGLGLPPSDETTSLYEQIRSGLADRRVPATRSRHNLPVQTTPFIGREDELAAIKARLSDPDCRLLTLIGPGGSGKTRLALEAAAAQSDNFERGVFFVSLAPLQSVDGIVPAVAQAIGFSFYEGGEPRQQLLDYLRQKRLLIIMDNFEHLLSPPSVPPAGGERGGADLVTDVLQTAPDVKILTTSRARLNLQGEHLFPVDGMDLPPLQSCEDEEQYSAVGLFLSSARRAGPGFELTDDNVKDVVRICRLVEGMPLGILLAAAWTRMLTPGEIADQVSGEIEGSIDFLVTEERDVPARQRSMRATLDHSWRLLTEREREVFRALSVFRGGFTREVAQAVIGASLQELMALVDKSLLHRAPTGRYDVHELLRQYAAEKLKLSSVASEKVGDRHCAHYIAALEQWGHDLKGARRLAALTEMNVEIENARRAWNWATERGQMERLERATLGLCLYYFLRGRHQECEAACAAAAQCLEGMMSGTSGAVQSLGKAERLRALARVLGWQARAVFGLGRTEDGQKLAQQSLALLDDPALVGQDTRAQRASIVAWTDHMAFYTEGKGMRPRTQSFEERLALYQEMGDRWMMAYVLHDWGNRAFWRGDLDEAGQRSREHLALCQELDHQFGIAGACMLSGNVARERGEFDKAEHLFRKAIKISREVQSPADIRWAQELLGRTLVFAGEFTQARQALEETLVAFGYLGDIAVAALRSDLASVEMHEGGYERACVQAETSLALSRKSRYRWGVAHPLHQLSCLAVVEAESKLGAGAAPQTQNTGKAREAYAEAQRLAQESATICREMGVRLWLGQPLAILGVAARGLGDVDRAQRRLCEALRVASDVGAFLSLMLALSAAALVLVDGGKHERAVEVYALASRYGLVANSRWFEDVAGRHIAEVAATLPPEVVEAAQERGRARDLDATVKELLAEFGERASQMTEMG